jgi:integrase/recombinase XerD
MKRPFLSKNNNGYYYIYYFIDESRRRITTDTMNKKKAEDIFNKFLNGESTFQLKFVLCSQLFNEYLEISKPPNKTENSYKTIKYLCNDFLRILSDKFVLNYTVKDIDLLLSKKIADTSVHNAKKMQRTIKAAFNQGIKWNYLRHNPFNSSMKIKIPESDLLFFKKEEFNSLISETDNETYKDLFTFAVLSGLRLSEVINLKVEDIDIKHKQIRVLSDNFHRTKSGKTRFVDLSNLLIPIVQKIKEKNQVYLFESNITKNKLDSRVVQEMTKKYIRKAGLNDRYSFHCFRKTFGKWLLDAGIDLKYISQQLGHCSVSVTEKHYAKYLKQEYKGYINKINLI